MTAPTARKAGGGEMHSSVLHCIKRNGERSAVGSEEPELNKALTGIHKEKLRREASAKYDVREIERWRRQLSEIDNRKGRHQESAAGVVASAKRNGVNGG